MDNPTFFDRFEKLLEKVRVDLDLKDKHDALISWFVENCFGIDGEEVRDRIVQDSHAEGVDGIFVDNQKLNLIFTEVLIRAVETTDKDFMDLVTLYTNSQNAIRLRDLCSNDDIQTSTQKILGDVYNYFYERKRGEFESLYPTNDAKKAAFGSNYKYKIISNEKAAQAFSAMFLDMPSEAKSQKGRIFMKDEGGFYKGVFNIRDELLPEKFFLSWMLLNFIEYKKKEYRKSYNKAELVDENVRQEIYSYDFLLHSEYFILNLFRDFLKNEKFDLNKREDLLKIIKMVKKEDKKINEIYEIIKKNLAGYVTELKNEPVYYHNKFFKNDKSIALVRNSFRNKYTYVDLLT